MYYTVYAIGWMLAKLPEGWVRCLCQSMGLLFYLIPSPRRNLIASNLHHAFPERSPEWLQRTLKRVCIRTAEMGLFTLVIPHFSMRRYLRCLEVTAEAEQLASEIVARGKPVLLCGMHFSMLEATNAWPALTKLPFPHTAVVYRPHRNPRIDAMIKQHRERAGFRLVSRKEGIKSMTEVMRANGVIALLFDQNTGQKGSLIPFFGRVTAATELPGLLAKKYDASVVMILPRRTAFWRAQLELEELDCAKDPGAITLASNRWLEEKLRSDDEILVDWLWSHNRWKILFRPFERLGMNHRKKLVDFAQYPIRKTRIALVHQHLGQWEPQALCFLKALRQSRPDAEITLITRAAEPLAQAWRPWVDVAHDLFDDAGLNRQLARALRDRYLDAVLVLDDDGRSRQFAKAMGVAQRLGVCLTHGGDRTLTESWMPTDPQAWKADPDWITFGRQFGLESCNPDAD